MPCWQISGEVSGNIVRPVVSHTPSLWQALERVFPLFISVSKARANVMSLHWPQLGIDTDCWTLRDMATTQGSSQMLQTVDRVLIPRNSASLISKACLWVCNSTQEYFHCVFVLFLDISVLVRTRSSAPERWEWKPRQATKGGCCSPELDNGVGSLRSEDLRYGNLCAWRAFDTSWSHESPRTALRGSTTPSVRQYTVPLKISSAS